MSENSLENVIRTYIPLPAHESSTGWFRVLCKKCNDHGRKGKRGGFRFDNNQVGYHCFNCGVKTVYNPLNHKLVPKPMSEVLQAFGVPKEEIDKINFQSLDTNTEEYKKQQQTFKDLNPPEVPLPDHFYKLSDAKEDDKFAELARYYLEDRGIDSKDYTFYLSTGGTENRDKDWLARLIIPFYKQDKLIFYQGRDMIDKKTLKYKSLDVTRSNIFWNFDEISKFTDEPLYVVEGFFDAYHIDGVASICNELTEHQLEILRRSPRQKVIIPDRFGSGHVMAEQAIKEGWQVALPEIGSCKDIDEAIKKYGKLYVLKSIVDHTYSDFAAKLHVKSLVK